ncbi:MAG: pseudouridine synthase [Deltaproteobacteria bacterium RBG_13_49_15]|nr:MAG: pseudouridine synthase [Deltaproteobacteria bacterium RBG_13_49_15]
MQQIRLQKYLSHAGICSRRTGEIYIAEGRVSVNGKVVSTLGMKVEPGKDRVEIDGKPVDLTEMPIYIALNKPRGYVTSCKHEGKRIVLELVDLHARIYPVGRLDKASTGLLLLTNDGELHHHLAHPSFDHEKEYEVEVAKPIPDDALKKMEKGISILGTQTRPAAIKRLSPTSFRIVLKEGRNRQIRRMVKEVDNAVEHLKRIRIANIRLGALAEGEWRHLTVKEKDGLLKRINR